jgi:hypothetical protein
MMHFLLQADLNVTAVAIRATVDNLRDIYDYKLTVGEMLGSNFPKLRLQLDDDGKPADYIESGPMLIISEKLKKIMETLNCLVEYHPVELRHKDGSSAAENYFLANILLHLDFLDQRAVYTMEDDCIDEIESLVVDDDKVEGVNLCYLKNAYDAVLLASDRFAILCRDQNVTGPRFILPDEWASRFIA